MGLYVYRCSNCGAVREEIRKVADRDAPATCLVCQEGSLVRRQVVRTARPKFKGSGFYATDYFNKSRPWDTISDEPPENWNPDDGGDWDQVGRKD